MGFGIWGGPERGSTGGWSGGSGWQPRQAPPPSAPPPAASKTLDPAYLAKMFPGGLPMSSIDVSPDAITQAIMSSLLPQFNQQDRGLQDALASAGIMGGAGIGAEAALRQQQQTTATGDVAPYIMQGKGMAIGQQEFDINNIIRAAMSDQNAQNAFMQFVLGNQNQDWLAQMGMAGNLATGGAHDITGAFNPTYQTPSNLGNSFMQFAGGMGGGGNIPLKDGSSAASGPGSFEGYGGTEGYA